MPEGLGFFACCQGRNLVPDCCSANRAMVALCLAPLLTHLRALASAASMQALSSAGGISRLGLKALLLPAVALGRFFVAAHMRVVRSSKLEVLNTENIKLLRGKGMPHHVVI